MSAVKKACICSFCTALCYVLPMAFHAVAAGGAASPMHLPVLLCGLICTWPYGLFCGFAGPVISSTLSGMPSPVQLIWMVPELCTYGAGASLFLRLVRTGRLAADLYAALLPAMVLGRVVGGAVQAVFYLSAHRNWSIAMWAGGYVAGTLPGILMQLILLPILVAALIRAGLIPPRYPAQIRQEEGKK